MWIAGLKLIRDFLSSVYLEGLQCQEIHHFYVTQRFIIVFTRGSNWILS
jgi:hypothetical protein